MNEILPNNPKSEAIVLGAMLTENKIIPEIMSMLLKDDFYIQKNADLYDIITDIFRNEGAVDMVLASERFEDMIYLAEITSNLPAASVAIVHAKKIKRSSLNRSVISYSNKIQMKAFNGEDLQDLLDSAASELAILNNSVAFQKTKSKTEIICDVKNPNKKDRYIPTLIKPLDAIIQGIKPGNLIYVCGSTTVGKSVLLRQIALNVARQQHAIYYWSGEMTLEENIERWLCCGLNTPIEEIREDRHGKHEELTELENLITSHDFMLDNNTRIDYQTLFNKIRQVNKDKHLSAVFFDYAQLLKITKENKRLSRQEQLAELSHSLKSFSIELSTSVICAVQPNREGKKLDRLTLYHMGGSGALEDDCDIAILLNKSEGKTIFNIGKHRGGVPRSTKLILDGRISCFYDEKEDRKSKTEQKEDNWYN